MVTPQVTQSARSTKKGRVMFHRGGGRITRKSRFVRTLAGRYPRQCGVFSTIVVSGLVLCLVESVWRSRSLEIAATLTLAVGLLYGIVGLAVVLRRGK